jgi:hypothetical protein
VIIFQFTKIHKKSLDLDKIHTLHLVTKKSLNKSQKLSECPWNVRIRSLSQIYWHNIIDIYLMYHKTYICGQLVTCWDQKKNNCYWIILVLFKLSRFYNIKYISQDWFANSCIQWPNKYYSLMCQHYSCESFLALFSLA